MFSIQFNTIQYEQDQYHALAGLQNIRLIREELFVYQQDQCHALAGFLEKKID